MAANESMRSLTGCTVVDSASFPFAGNGRVIWHWAYTMSDWVRENGEGIFYWHVSPPEHHDVRQIRFQFSDPDTAVAFKMRWG